MTTAAVRDFVHTSASGAPGVTLHVVEGGPSDPTVPRVVLLHGFPEHWATWKHLMGALVDDGHGVAAPDLRGFGGSDKPKDVALYTIDKLLDDVEAVIRARGHEKAHVIGHDWGGVLAWWCAIKRPHLVDKLVILNAPHPIQFLKQLQTPAQMLRSSYMLLFGSPLGAPALRAFDYAPIRAMLKGTSKQDSYSDDDVNGCVDALRGDGLECALLYYRAAVKGAANKEEQKEQRALKSRMVAAKTLIVWGVDDIVLKPHLIDDIERFVPDVKVVKLAKTSHWVQHDSPEELAAAVKPFLRKS